MNLDPRAILAPRNISDRAALAIIAWHALLASGHATPHGAPREAYEAADWMLKEIVVREGSRT